MSTMLILQREVCLYSLCNGYNYESASILRPFDCFVKAIKLRVMC